MRTLIKDVWLNTKETNILIEGNRFLSVDAGENASADKIIDAKGLAILPAFYNTHNHAAMTLLRGYADDMPLQTWLQDYIWPYEDTLKPVDIRKGSKLAIDEMLATGTVFFNDMYFDIEETMDEINKAGSRACIGITVMDMHSKAVHDQKVEYINAWKDRYDDRVTIAVAPHSVYCVGTENLKEAAKNARDKGIKLHIHLSETRQEVEDCIKQYGMSPVRYLDKIGFLGPDVVAAHCVHIDKEEWDILAERGVTVSHCPCSNMKLGSGRFPYELAIASGARITLGTDGCSSNNNLDMREEMKFAALLAKVNGDPSILPAEQVLKWATQNGAEAFGIDAGVIADGKLADAILVDLNNRALQPNHHIISNWVYAADSSCISKVLCDGKIVYSK